MRIKEIQYHFNYVPGPKASFTEGARVIEREAFFFPALIYNEKMAEAEVKRIKFVFIFRSQSHHFLPWLLVPEIFVRIFPDSFSPAPVSCQDNALDYVVKRCVWETIGVFILLCSRSSGDAKTLSTHHPLGPLSQWAAGGRGQLLMEKDSRTSFRVTPWLCFFALWLVAGFYWSHSGVLCIIQKCECWLPDLWLSNVFIFLFLIKYILLQYFNILKLLLGLN